MLKDELEDILTRLREVEKAYEDDPIHQVEGPVAMAEMRRYLEEKLAAENKRLEQGRADAAGAFRLTQ